MAQLHCAILTFNCGREAVKPAVFAKHISESLKDGLKHDLIIFSLQEISPLSYGFIGGRCLSYYYEKIDQALETATGNAYTQIFTKNIGITAAMVYVHRDRKDRVNSITSGSVGVGYMEMGNKGAVGTRISWKISSGRHIDLTFVAAHLAPHEPGLERRNQDWMQIVRRLVFQPVRASNSHLEASHDGTANSPSATTSEENQPLLSKSVTPDDGDVPLTTIYSPTSYTFVAGDLNYRTANDHPKPSDYAKYPKFPNASSDLVKNLLEHDQLTAERKKGKTLHGFQEAEIEFPPTYKYTSDSRQDTAEAEEGGTYALHRWPSWCDRILYLPPLIESEGREAVIINNFYRSLPLMSTSDHQPVVASFSISMESTVTTMAHRSTGVRDYRLEPPYAIDPLWQKHFNSARRREFVVGVLAYLGMTWEGNSILLTAFIGVIGVYLTSRFGLF